MLELINYTHKLIPRFHLTNEDISVCENRNDIDNLFKKVFKKYMTINNILDPATAISLTSDGISFARGDVNWGRLNYDPIITLSNIPIPKNIKITMKAANANIINIFDLYCTVKQRTFFIFRIRRWNDSNYIVTQNNNGTTVLTASSIDREFILDRKILTSFLPTDYECSIHFGCPKRVKDGNGVWSNTSGNIYLKELLIDF